MLHRLEALNHDIRVAIIGIGSIGKGMALQCQLTPRIECVALADIKLERAVACAEWLQRDYQVVTTLPGLHQAVRRGKLAVCEDGLLLARCEVADVLIESSNAMAAGGQFAISALEHDKHLVMMNAEADLLFGPKLLQLARQNGVVYSSADGDQPVVIRRLIDELQFWGFELVMAGNIKGYLDRNANPTSIIPEADKRSLDYKMCTSYTDGTKLCVEMALVANAFGLRTAVPGMLGPRARDVHEVFAAFDFPELWAQRQPVVDYLLGAKPTGGVFAIGYTENPFQQYTLDWFPPDMGPGPFYLFYRPYHLGHFEALSTVVEAVLDRHSLLQPEYGFQTQVFAYAKRDLRPGERLDGIGGYCCYGLIDNVPQDDAHPGLPICLAEEVTLSRAVAKDSPILMSDIVSDPGRFDFELYAAAVECSRRGHV